jgi:hypothetical protein
MSIRATWRPGLCAARAAARRITRVVLLGPVHRVAVRGLAVHPRSVRSRPRSAACRSTPRALAIAGRAASGGASRSAACAGTCAGGAAALPAGVLGRAGRWCRWPWAMPRPAEVDEVLERVWGGDETLIVISSDLSHTCRMRRRRTRDRAHRAAHPAFREDLRGDEACGAAPLNGALRAAKPARAGAALLDLRNSGDSAGAAVTAWWATAPSPSTRRSVNRQAGR